MNYTYKLSVNRLIDFFLLFDFLHIFIVRYHLEKNHENLHI